MSAHVDVVPPPSKRAVRYCGEAVKILMLIDRTAVSNWSSLSGLLAQLLKCIDGNAGAAAEILPDPALLCRALWKCLDPKCVMGVHRKALDVLQRLCQSLGASSLLRQMPLMLVGVLELLPLCSIQVKCDLLRFVDVYMLRELPPHTVTVELPGILSGILNGLEENDTSEIYRVTLKIMDDLHVKLSHLSGTSSMSETSEKDNAFEKHGDVIMYSALWLTMKNSRFLRSSVLVYMKLRLHKLMSHNHNQEEVEEEEGDSSIIINTTVEQQNSETHLSASAASSMRCFFGKDPHSTLQTIFMILQDRNERDQRLLLDILISALPLKNQTLFSFSESSVLVAAVIQLLGLPHATMNLRRRIIEWLTGPCMEEVDMYVQEVSCFLIAEAFHCMFLWWESFCCTPQSSNHYEETGAEKASVSSVHSFDEGCYYRVLFTSACKQYLPFLIDPTSCKELTQLTEVYITPIVWLHAFMSLFKHVMRSTTSDNNNNKSHGDGEEDEDYYYYHQHQQEQQQEEEEIDNYVRATKGQEREEEFSQRLGNVFLDHVVPLVMPFVCDLLIAVEERRRADERQGGVVDATLSGLFSVIPWDYFIQYGRHMIALLERSAASIHESTFGICGNNSTRSRDTVVGVSCSLEKEEREKEIMKNKHTTAEASFQHSDDNGDYSKEIFDLQISFRKLRGLISAVELHILSLMREEEMKQAISFSHGIFCISQSLCNIIVTTCEVLSTYYNSTSSSIHENNIISVARCLMNESLNSFQFIFFGFFATLQNQLPHIHAEKQREYILLDMIIKSSTLINKFIGIQFDVWDEVFENMNKTILHFFQYLEHIQNKYLLSPAKRSDVSAIEIGSCVDACTEEKWLISLFDFIQSKHFLFLKQTRFFDLINLIIFSESSKSTTGDMKMKIIMKLWELLSTSQGEVRREIIKIFIKLYKAKNGKIVLDKVIKTQERNEENYERLLILFHFPFSDEEGEDRVRGKLFLPVFLMIVQTMKDDKNVSLRLLGQTLVRRSLSSFQCVLDPLFECLAKYFTKNRHSQHDERKRGKKHEGPEEENEGEKREEEEEEMSHVSPMEFVSLMNSILTVPSLMQPLLQRLCQMKPPACARELLMTIITPAEISESECTQNEDEGGEVEPPLLDSAFMSLCCALFLLARRSILLHADGTLVDSPHVSVNLCFEACAALNLLLEGAPSLSSPSKTVIYTWRYTSIHMIHLLRETVTRPPFCAVQVLMLRHVLGTFRFLNAFGLVGDSSTCCCYHYCPYQDSARARSTADGDTSSTSHFAANMDAFYTTAAAGVTEAILMALSPVWDVNDLLFLWTDTLPEFLPILNEDCSVATSIRLVDIFLHAIDNIILQCVPSTDYCSILRVVGKCLGFIHDVLEYNFLTEKHKRQRDTDVASLVAAGRRGPGSWLASHIPIFSSNGSSATQKGMSADIESLEIVRQSTGPIVSMLCKVYCSMRASCLQTLLREEKRRICQVHGNTRTSHVEGVIHRLLQLYAEEVGVEFYRVFINVWAASYVELPMEWISQLKDVLSFQKEFYLLGNISATNPSDSSNGRMMSEMPPSLTDQEGLVQLLYAGTGITVLAFIHVSEELLASHRSMATSTTATVSSRSHRSLLGAEMPFDASVFYFVYTSLCTARIPSSDAKEILSALVNVTMTHLSKGSPSMICLAFILQVLSYVVVTQSTLKPPPSSSLSLSLPLQVNNNEEGVSVEWGKNKHCAHIVCKVLDAFGHISLHTTVSTATTSSSLRRDLLFSLKILSLTLPVLTFSTSSDSSTSSDQERVANAALNFYKRCLLPIFLFGIESHADDDVLDRTPLVKAALSAMQALIKLGDIATRRLRQEFLDTLFTCDFFRFPQDVIHEWSAIFERLSQDRAFHADVVKFFTPSTSSSSRIAALVLSSEEEERQRLRQMKQLIFYTMSVSPLVLMMDRGFCLLIYERIADDFRTFSSTFSGNTAPKRRSYYLAVRHSLFLFRVMLTKIDPSLLHPFWPFILPGVVHALTLLPPQLSGESTEAEAAAGSEGKSGGEAELLALQMECLKLLDFAVVIMPEIFAPFRWVFFDDLDICASSPNDPSETFTPIVCRLRTESMPRVVSLREVWVPPDATVPLDALAHWEGYQRPLLRFPSACYYSILGAIRICAGALSLFSQSYDIVGACGAEERSLSVLLHNRLMDGWDEAYVRTLIEADFSSCVEEGATAGTPHFH